MHQQLKRSSPSEQCCLAISIVYPIVTADRHTYRRPCNRIFLALVGGVNSLSMPTKWNTINAKLGALGDANLRTTEPYVSSAPPMRLVTCKAGEHNGSTAAKYHCGLKHEVCRRGLLKSRQIGAS